MQSQLYQHSVTVGIMLPLPMLAEEEETDMTLEALAVTHLEVIKVMVEEGAGDGPLAHQVVELVMAGLQAALQEEGHGRHQVQTEVQEVEQEICHHRHHQEVLLNLEEDKKMIDFQK